MKFNRICRQCSDPFRTYRGGQWLCHECTKREALQPARDVSWMQEARAAAKAASDELWASLTDYSNDH
jgi:hypothetical protein